MLFYYHSLSIFIIWKTTCLPKTKYILECFHSKINGELYFEIFSKRLIMVLVLKSPLSTTYISNYFFDCIDTLNYRKIEHFSDFVPFLPRAYVDINCIRLEHYNLSQNTHLYVVFLRSHFMSHHYLWHSYFIHSLLHTINNILFIISFSLLLFFINIHLASLNVVRINIIHNNNYFFMQKIINLFLGFFRLSLLFH